MSMKHSQQGTTVIEVLGVLAITAILLLSLTSMVDASVNDVKGQQTARHQEQVVNAANKYITKNYTELVKDTIAVGTVTAVTLAQLKADGFLPNSFANTNAFNQTPCVLVRKSSSSTVDALVATYGGQAIPERDIPLVGMYAGQGGGYISTEAPGTARGASWNLVTNNYRGVACGGTTVLDGSSTNDGGHLVSSLFYDGPGQLSTDFLYRSSVQGKPDLNQMDIPLKMASDAIVNENDPCGNTAAIAFDSDRNQLNCDLSGVWKRVTTWKRPVNTFTDLPATDAVGDVRITLDTGRAFMYAGGGNWSALAVDQNGDLHVARDVVASRDVNLGQDVNLGRNVNLGHDVNAGGTANFGQDVNGKNANITQDVNVGRNANIHQDVNVTRNANITQDVNVGRNANITQDVNARNDVNAVRDVNAGRYVHAGQ